MKCLTTIAIGGILATGLSFAQTSSATSQKTTKEYVDLLRSDLRKEKSSVVDQAMGLDSAQKAKFYPIYQQYEKELTGLFDRRMTNIKKYAENYPGVSDAVADELVSSAMTSQTDRMALWKKYHAQMKSALGSKIAARFVQVENTLAQLVDLQLNSELPLMP